MTIMLSLYLTHHAGCSSMQTYPHMSMHITPARVRYEGTMDNPKIGCTDSCNSYHLHLNVILLYSSHFNGAPQSPCPPTAWNNKTNPLGEKKERMKEKYFYRWSTVTLQCPRAAHAHHSDQILQVSAG